MSYDEIDLMSYNVKCYIIRPSNSKRWLVLGKTKEYLVTTHSCTCRDFLTKIMKKEGKICKHIKELENAKESNKFDSYEISITEFKELRPYLLELKK